MVDSTWFGVAFLMVMRVMIYSPCMLGLTLDCTIVVCVGHGHGVCAFKYCRDWTILFVASHLYGQLSGN